MSIPRRAPLPGAWGALLLLVVSGAASGCRYNPRTCASAAEPEGCGSHCASMHQRCVEGGEARRIGLAGVTYELCRRELEDCTERCRTPVERGACQEPQATGAHDTPIEPPPETLDWDPEMAVVRCPLGLGGLSLPPDVVPHVRRLGPNEVRLELAPDAVLMLRSGRGPPPPLVEDWLNLHAQLTGAKQEELAMRLDGSSTAAGSWEVEYSVREDTTETPFRAASRTAQRGGAHCRVVAVEKAGVAPERSATRLLQDFGAP